MYSFNVNEGNITELLFLSLFEYHWDSTAGEIYPVPMIAEKWNWAPDSSSLDIQIRKGLKWSDGIDLTIDDIIHSFDIYSQPDAGSRMYGGFDKFFLTENGAVDPEKSFERLENGGLRIKFVPESKPTYYDLDFPILPYHYFKNISFDKISADSFNISPITSGPYKLKEWYRGQYIKLEADTNSYLITRESVRELIFKIVPDYSSRLNQLVTGEIDLMEDIKTADLQMLQSQNNLKSASVKGREYDYFGWNHLNPTAFRKGSEEPNKLFGNVLVRRALSKLIDRNAIIENYLHNYAQECHSPVSPIFTRLRLPRSDRQPMDVEEAKKMLKNAGWADSDNNGILDKDGLNFEFTLAYPTGNPRREYAATIFASNAKEAGILVNLQPIQMGSLIEGMQNKSLDAWIAGWVIPIPLEMRIFWHSDRRQAPLNFQGFKNPEIDSLLDLIDGAHSEQERVELIKKFQLTLAELQPVTFLYWIDNIIFYNSRIRDIGIDPLGVIHHCWNWQIVD